jgi:hypothetical protein
MRNSLISLLAAIVLVACFSLAAPTVASACMLQDRGGTGRAGTGEFDHRDFSGIWFRAMGRGAGPDDGGDCGFSPANMIPPLTKEGEEAIKKNIPSGKPRNPFQSAEGSVDFNKSNDPAFACNPKGMPQIVVDTAHDHHEVIETKDRILQIWQEERRLREIWMDGRPVPSGEALQALGPSWYGMSVGHWEGDTLVVETVGLDERAWVDINGYPKSADAKIVERYRLRDAVTLEAQLTLIDPKYYTKPWVSDIKRWKREAYDSKNVNHFGWHGLFSGLTELICAPVNGDSRNPSNARGGD